ncbi:hypothetical protein LUZ63_000202 [Rhynchospora breviuscula]|uniref:Pentatricopeptide repeat-containing protein n=1 Tax=Rhynchospora breviuscula TaxID=2022672 RepID=A0A9Q0HWM9_9POAL|nr:hypothetical protein LUZ63_000202 [Rhynchospora breviuscula]
MRSGRRENLQLQEAVSHFQRLLNPHNRPPSIRSINGHLKSIANTNHPDRYSTVISLFNRLKRTRDPSVSPNVYTFGLVIDCCCRMGRVDLGFCALGQSLRAGFGANSIMFGSLIKGLCTRKQPAIAVKVLAKMPRIGCAPSVIVYSTLIDYLCNNGNTWKGLELCHQMARDGSCCKPDVVTYTTLIRGFCRESDIPMALKTFKEMVSNGVTPSIFALNILIDNVLKTGPDRPVRPVQPRTGP